MKIKDIIYETNKKPIKKDNSRFSKTIHGNWEITVDNFRNSHGKYEAIARHRHHDGVSHKVEADAAEEAKDKAIAAATKPQHVDHKNKKLSLNLNSEFTRSYLKEADAPYYFKIEQQDDKTYLIMCGEFEKEEAKNLGYIVAHPRMHHDRIGETGVNVWKINLPLSISNELKLHVHGRYFLAEPKTDEYDNLKFEMIYDSMVDTKEQKKRLHGPGLTVVPDHESSMHT